MVEIPKFKSPSLFCLTVGISLVAWFYTHAFVLLDKYMPMEFSLQEELLVSEAQLESAKMKGDEVQTTVAEAKFNAAKYKNTQFNKVMDGAFELHSHSLWVGILFLLLSIPAFIIEIGWQKKAFNQAVNRTPKP
nr:hypothetical protein [uncultured Marinobacter sp.]